jgi:CheY-like chemotaxis protein
MLLVHERRPDLVLTDLHMPGTDGFALLRRLRADPATATIPVVAVSASAMSAEVDRGLRAGFDDYLTKPLDLERVLATVARLTAPRG